MKLSKIVRVFNGYQFTTHEFNQNNQNGYPIIKIKELKKGSILFTNDTCYVEEKPSLGRYIVVKGDCLIALTGNPLNKGGFDAIVGRASIYNNDSPGYINQRVCKVESKSNILLNKYLAYFLSLDNTTIQLASRFTGSANQANISFKDILDLDIDLPTLKIQQHIVNTIGSVDDLIEFNNKIIDKLKIYSDLIYQDYLNRSYNNTSVKLGDYCEIKTGKLNVNSAVENGKYPFFTCGSEYLYINNYAYDCKAIIISGNGVITCKYYDGKFNAYQRTYVLTPKKYFYLFLKSCEFEVNNLNINSSGSVIKFITKSMIEKISIILNIYSTITDDRIAKIYNLISKYKQQNIKLQKIKQHLLNKYF